MFEIQSKHSGRLSHGSKNNSRKKINTKQFSKPNQKIVMDIIKTDSHSYERSYSIKQKKSKSQCVQQPHAERKSIDISKFIQTTRSTCGKKSKEKLEKVSKILHQLKTQEKNRHQNIFMSNVNTQKSTQLKWSKKPSLKKHTQQKSTQKRRNVWNQKAAPYTWQYVLQNYSHHLTKHEQSQIKQYKKIYYIGHRALKSQKIHEHTPVFDNQQKEYIHIENDHIAYRYEILSSIGKGSYGQVYKVFDHKNKQQLALKIVKNDPKYSKQAFVQVKILSYIKEQDDDQSNVVKIRDFVVFRKHVCILFQLLSSNLYELIIRNNYNGLNEQLIRRFSIQILFSLEFLKKQRIIHCDLKPQNILLKQYNKSGIKIIDFGSSCFEHETIYTYIQSRYYRAPQITLGISYSCEIDIWSTGCILAELYTGVPVFPGENELQQIKYMTDTLGVPTKNLLKRGSRSNIFFDQKGNIKQQINALKTTMDMFSKPLKQRIQQPDFLSFIESFLKWTPEQRTTPLEALNHPWISKGLPQQLKNKLNFDNTMLRRRWHSKDIEATSARIKTKSKEKNGSSVKIVKKESQQKIKKAYGFKI